MTDRFEEAVGYSTLAIQSNPGFSMLHAGLAASNAMLDRPEAARAAAARLLEVAPGWTIAGFVRMELLPPELMARFAEALRKAGLPK